MTRNVLSLALLGLLPLGANAAIRWQTTTATASPFPAAVLLDQNGIALPADPGPGAVGGTGGYDGLGYFVQLIWAGPNGVVDAVNTATYVPGTSVGTEGTDDRVIDTSFIGRARTGLPGASTNPLGHIVNQTAPEVTAGNGGGSTGQSYYIRTWNATVNSGRLFDDNVFAPVAGGGLAPSAAATQYGNSSLFTTADPNDGNSEIFTAAGFSTSIPVIVPEPATASLLGLGIAGVGMAIKRRRQQS